MSDETYGTVRRCVRDGHTDCEASRDDCLVELVPTHPPEVVMDYRDDLDVPRVTHI